jgi:adenylate cyclase
VLRVAPASARRRPFARWRWPLALAALLAGLGLEWLDPPYLPGLGLDRLISDQVVRWKASDKPEQRLAVVDIDEHSLAALGPWPWPRARLADLVESLLSDYGARGIALDLVLPEPASGNGDARLAALAEHTPTVFSQAFDYVPRIPALRVGVLAGSGDSAGIGATAVPVDGTGFIGNFRGLSQAPHVGNVGLLPDVDGAIRRLPLLTQYEQQRYLPLSFVLLRAAGMPLPAGLVTRTGFWTIPYNRSWSAFTVIPASEVLANRVPREELSGRLVLVGSSSFGLADRVATPLDKSTSGVMVHAAAVSALLDQGLNGQAQFPDPRWLATFWLVAAAVFSLFALPRLSAFWIVTSLTLFSITWMVLVFTWIPASAQYSPVGPLATVLLLMLLAVPNEWRLAQLESNRLIHAFQHYVAKPVLDELLSRGGLESLEPRLLQVTTLVADMQGYSGLVENASLSEAVALTRDFLDCITRPVLEHEGTLDKYIGDGLMSFWGAPLASDDHADRALDAALQMLAAVREFNRARVAAGKAPVRVRIGVETGLAVAGDLGTPFRSVYTAVGDSVNVASRLQEVARPMAHDIVIGPGTASQARRHDLVSLGSMNIRGRKSQTEIFTLRVAA